MSHEDNINIFYGDRGKKFISMLTDFLSRGKLKAKYMEILLRPENIKLYAKAFTAASANANENYENYEQLGDATANQFIVWYSYNRFPQLDCPLGVKVVARLRINYGAKNSFAKIAKELGFWPFISAAIDGENRSAKYRMRHEDDLLEDVLEAIIGCTQQILDRRFQPGVGYAIVYNILSSIFDNMQISLKFEDLIDAKTRMKEVFDANKEILGSFKFIDERREEFISNDEIKRIAVSRLYQVPPRAPRHPIRRNIDGEDKFLPRLSDGWKLIGEGEARRKAEAQQIASKIAIKKFKITRLY